MKKITLFTKAEAYEHFSNDIKDGHYYDCEQYCTLDVSNLQDFPLKFIVSDEVYEEMTDTYMNDLNINVVERSNPMVAETMRSVCGRYNFPRPFFTVETITDQNMEEEYNNAMKGKSYLVKKMIKQKKKSLGIGFGIGVIIGGIYLWRKL